MPRLHTKRLELIPLNANQLKLYLETPSQLEMELGLPLSHSIITDRVRHAIGMKLKKMESVEEEMLVWITYWLIVIRNIPFGAGLVGFKGVPDPNGEVEIGYGIDFDYQKQGFMTEAVRKMIQWAFEQKVCHSIVAIGVDKTNPASRRVLEKAGLTVYEESEDVLSFRIKRDER
jgi:ribosomal-protein-alanine N-acetyltransferase